MDWSEFIVYIWLWPVTVQLLIPLALSCLGLTVMVVRRVGSNMPAGAAQTIDKTAA
jgi:hypothetical protein